MSSQTEAPTVLKIENDETPLSEEDSRLLEERKKSLIGKVVRGVLIKRRGGFFVKYTDDKTNNVFITSDNVMKCLGANKNPGMVAVVECTITALGPSYKPWDQQHPVSKSVKMVSQYVRDAKKGEDLDAKRAALGLDSLSSLRTRFERDRTDRSTRSCGPPVKRKASLKSKVTGINNGESRSWRGMRTTTRNNWEVQGVQQHLTMGLALNEPRPPTERPPRSPTRSPSPHREISRIGNSHRYPHVNPPQRHKGGLSRFAQSRFFPKRID